MSSQKPPDPPAPDNDPAPQPQPQPQPQTIVVQQPDRRGKVWTRLLLIALVVSILVNFALYGRYRDYFSGTEYPKEKYYSGPKQAADKIALIKIDSTIMPPYTKRILDAIERAGESKAVKGVLIVVDSPGGLVADSHQILHALEELRVKKNKPIVVSMKRMAASGGYYVSMGAGPEGRIFAEPTTWTGSIGVIIPHFDVSGLMEEWKIESEPLKTGQYKDALSPFRELTEDEKKIWGEIMDDAFQRFLGVIAENRANLDKADVEKLATGQVYTAEQAVQNGLVDEIGYEEDAIDYLKEKLGLEKARIVTYQHQPTLTELLTGSVKASQPEDRFERLLKATVPRAMYLCSWLPAVPAGG